MTNREHDEQKQAAIQVAPTAFEFLESKNLNSEGVYTHIPTSELAALLDEFHAIASGNKILIDRKFENVIDRDYKGEQNKAHE